MKTTKKEAAPAATRRDPKGASVRAGTKVILHRFCHACKMVILTVIALAAMVSAVYWLLSACYGPSGWPGQLLMAAGSFIVAWQIAGDLDRMDADAKGGAGGGHQQKERAQRERREPAPQEAVAARQPEKTAAASAACGPAPGRGASPRRCPSGTTRRTAATIRFD